MKEKVRLGIIGCGGFGLFALQNFMQLPQLELAGISGTHREAAKAAAARFGVEEIEEVPDMLARDDIDLVYISTPPFLHYEQSLEALNNDKHVICEKPLALTVEQADEMLALAEKKDRLLVTNLMQRYNPLYESVATMLRTQPLGELLHGFFENYASDEGLDPDHWFWDPEKSGGIFIEHGVHFFDMFEGWIGQGEMVAAQRTLRPGSGIEDQVQCTVKYGETVMVNFYHGFTQPVRLDRQELRLVFERGDISLFEWIPSYLRIHAIADEASTKILSDLFPYSTIDMWEPFSGEYRKCKARHKEHDVAQLFDMQFAMGQKKWVRYGEILRAMMKDQIAWIADRNHSRTITAENGRNSLVMAVKATEMAREYS